MTFCQINFSDKMAFQHIKTYFTSLLSFCTMTLKLVLLTNNSQGTENNPAQENSAVLSSFLSASALFLHSKKFLGRRQKNSEVHNGKLQFSCFRPTFGPIWTNFTCFRPIFGPIWPNFEIFLSTPQKFF